MKPLKMTDLFLILLVLSTYFLVNSLKIGSNSVLERLCQSSAFDYKDSLKKIHHVNAFHRIEHSVKLKPIGYYGLDTQLNFRDYFENEIGEQLNHLKSDYNQALLDLYSESYLNGESFRVDWTKYGRFADMRDAFKAFQNQTTLGDKAAVKLEETIERAGRVMQLAGQLMNYKVEFLHPEILSLTDFQQLIGSLKIDPLTESMVFTSDSIIDTYRKLIFKFDRFKFNSRSKLFFDWKSDGTIVSSIYLPFELKEELKEVKKSKEKWNSLTTNGPCRSVENMPKFFSSKNGRVR